MAFKGSIIHTPQPRRRRWHKRQPPPVPKQLYLHIGGRVLMFDSKEDFRQFAERRLREIKEAE